MRFEPVEQHPPLQQYLLKRTGTGKADLEDYFLACVGDAFAFQRGLS